MRLKIKLPLDKIHIKENALLVSKYIHSFLGVNNKWHDMDIKPYSVSMIMGGERKNGFLNFKKDSHIFINSVDVEVISTIMDNIFGKYEFEVVENKFRIGVNILTASFVKYDSDNKTNFINSDNKIRFEKYVKNRLGIDIEILEFNFYTKFNYKNNSSIKTSSLLFKLDTNNIEDVKNIFNSGLGGSTAIGFGFVNNINDKFKEEQL